MKRSFLSLAVMENPVKLAPVHRKPPVLIVHLNMPAVCVSHEQAPDRMLQFSVCLYIRILAIWFQHAINNLFQHATIYLDMYTHILYSTKFWRFGKLIISGFWLANLQ